MASGGFSSWQVSQWIDALLAQDLWVGAVSADPRGLSDPFSVEILGDSYERQQPALLNGNGNSIVVNDTLTFLGIAPETPIAGVILTNNDTNGNFIACALLDDPITLTVGGAWVVDADEIVFGIDMVSP